MKMTPGAISRARLDKAFTDAGWHFHAGKATGRSVDVYLRNAPGGAPDNRWMMQVYRHPSGRVTGATFFDGDGHAYPFDSRRVVGQILDYLAGVRFDVITYNGAVPTFGVRYGRSAIHVRPTHRSARDLANRRNAAGETVEIRRVDPRPVVTAPTISLHG